MATKKNPDLIDAMLREDEEELRAKKKRLHAFRTALNDARRASTQLAAAGKALLDAGDVTRAEAAKLFGLTKQERAVALPTRRRSEPNVPDPVDDQPHASNHPSDKPDETNN
ncbi:hypothetical protein GZ998_08950 [Actinomyces sp. 594]|uniref:hypothetical protein n=1 Tax=Actinomyces sp. 594 TaxID=2057793 RepID=UPI001C59F544|nr:hypothetical protein [Actinomyces sp. 594]MBW3069627.1 hypothetical protein [Actinomyces sp. 594]